MFNNYCICITCAGGTLKKQEGVFLKKYSKYKKILTLIGTDKNSNKVSKRVFDYTYQLPSPFSKKYIGSLLNIIKKHKVNLIIACSDGVTPNCFRTRETRSKTCGRYLFFLAKKS